MSTESMSEAVGPTCAETVPGEVPVQPDTQPSQPLASGKLQAKRMAKR
jgi:hypothetical protein